MILFAIITVVTVIAAYFIAFTVANRKKNKSEYEPTVARNPIGSEEQNKSYLKVDEKWGNALKNRRFLARPLHEEILEGSEFLRKTNSKEREYEEISFDKRPRW